MKLEYFILGMLKLKPYSGYGLKKFLDTEGRFVRPRTPLSQVYSTLKRMTDRGFLTYVIEPVDGKPDRKIYSVTEEGDVFFKAWLTSPHEPGFRFQDRELMGKLFFSVFVGETIILQHMRTELAYRKDQVDTFRPRDRTLDLSLDSKVDPERIQAVADLLHQYGADSIDQYIIWLENSIAYFENLVDGNG